MDYLRDLSNVIMKKNLSTNLNFDTSAISKMIDDVYKMAQSPIEIMLEIYKKRDNNNREKIGSGSINVKKNVFDVDIKLDKLADRLNNDKKSQIKKHYSLFSSKMKNSLNYFKDYNERKEALEKQKKTSTKNSYNIFKDPATGNFNTQAEIELNKIKKRYEEEESNEEESYEDEEDEEDEEDSEYSPSKDDGYTPGGESEYSIFGKPAPHFDIRDGTPAKPKKNKYKHFNPPKSYLNKKRKK